MSKPMTCRSRRSRPVRAIADDPAGRAGQDRVLAGNSSAAVRPPDDIMNITRAPVRSTSSVVATTCAT